MVIVLALVAMRDITGGMKLGLGQRGRSESMNAKCAERSVSGKIRRDMENAGKKETKAAANRPELGVCYRVVLFLCLLLRLVCPSGPVRLVCPSWSLRSVVSACRCRATDGRSGADEDSCLKARRHCARDALPNHCTVQAAALETS